ncbi:MAG: methyl-accepting chemotaxis protein [Pseudomonadales bacterium]|nr:methyl-accepting chemotaxis protein [Pseudomonadales bacterium]NRA17958.1 HAMP domain-containing protein [Oceanospirillaceae bacterium]
MNLTVTQRIGGGFTLLVILLLIISSISFVSLTKVNEQLEITNQQITPIIVHSGEMAVSLLSANQALMLFMDNHSDEALEIQQQAFEKQQQNYAQQRSQLLAVGQHYSEVESAINSLDKQVSAYFSNATLSLAIHRNFLNTNHQLVLLQQQLQLEMKTFYEDIALLVTYGLNSDEKSIGRALEENLKIVEGQFKQLLDANSLQQVEEIELSLSSQGYGFGMQGLQENLQKLVTSGSDTSPELPTYMAVVQAAITEEQGLVQLYKKKMQQQEQLELTLVDLLKSVQNSTQALDLLMDDALKLADTVKTDTEDQVQLTQLINIVVSALSVLIAAIIGLWVCRNIRNSLRSVMAILKVIANGDLSQRLSITSKDEFGQLSEWVNELVEKQQQMIRNIQDTADQISGSARQSSQLSNNSNLMMREQQQQTEQVATAMSQMSSSVAEVAKSAEMAQQRVTDIDNTASENRTLMQQNVQQVNALAQEIDQAADVIHSVNEDSANIGRIVEVIESIAGQTNLLALNAAIEAARAGEQGRGFAVVADEVRTLASRTQGATKEIQQMIDKLQSGAKNAVTLMDSSRTSVQSSLQQTENVGESLIEMLQQLAQVRQMSVDIAAAAEEQTAVSLEISQSVVNIAVTSENSAKDAEQGVQSSEVLAGLAEQQLQMIQQFKLN